MTDKTFPPPQALRVVPLDESQNIRSQLAEFDNDIVYVVRSDVEKLVEFVEQFRPQDCPDMAILAGNVREIKITDASVDEEQIDLVRLNGRVYAPEIIVEDDTVELPCVRKLDVDDLEQIISETLDPDWTPRLAARAVHAEIYGEAE